MKTKLSLISGAVTASVLAYGLLSAVSGLPAAASRLPSGRVVFDSSLELIDVSPLEANGEPERYQVVIQIPLTAAEPLEALVIKPRDSNAGLSFDLNTTEVFVGDTYGLGPEVPLASVGGTPLDLNQVLVVLENPAPPGTTLSIVLNPQQRPADGVYELGITAYPAGEDSVGQFLGYGQIQVGELE
ncbi:MAG: DUF2808 domain-containing protein [Cyanobacteria bacterium Co-bin8]|nr:DUF2808 domain-containing protein [Cyanobacteria bacterium Co-bin8]